MKLILFLALVAAASANLLQFNTMTSCTVGINYTQAVSDYLGYGCYCGFGGKGTPKDDTDKCCDSHDACYREAMNHGCGMADRYLITYDYTSNKADDGTCQLTCKLQADYPADDVEAECKAFMCGCDSKGSECFAANRPTFDDKYKDFPQLLCW